MTQRIDQGKIKRRALEEAISAGNAVLFSLDKVLERLKHAARWGIWDVFGGGLLCSAAKYTYIDDAKAEVEKTLHLLHTFQQELADIKISEEIERHLEFHLSESERLADIYLNMFLVDGHVQGKISGFEQHVSSVREQVSAVIEKLSIMEKIEITAIFRDETNLQALMKLRGLRES